MDIDALNMILLALKKIVWNIRMSFKEPPLKAKPTSKNENENEKKTRKEKIEKRTEHSKKLQPFKICTSIELDGFTTILFYVRNLHVDICSFCFTLL